MKTSRVLAGLLVSIAILTSATRASAAESATKEHAEATKRFNHGLYLADNGAYPAALAELERAHELAPSRVVLFHTAMVYVAMDRPVDALETLDEVLSMEGPLSPEYLERAKAARSEQEKRIGELDVKADIPAAIQVDGEHVGDAPLKEPLKVAAGAHVVCIVAPGHVPARRSITVAAQGNVGIEVVLEPTQAKLAHVTVHSRAPGFDVRVDDVPVGRTPFAEPVILLPGKHVFDLRRPGYKSTTRTVEIADGVYSTVAIAPAEDTTPGSPRGRLRLVAGDANATDAPRKDMQLTIDDRDRGTYREPIELPAGPHALKIERAGDESIERMVEVAEGDETVVKVSFRATAQARGVVASRANTQKHWAIAALVSGAVVAGASTGLAIWSNGKLGSANDRLAVIQKDAAAGGPCDPSRVNDVEGQLCRRKMVDAQHKVDTYRNARLGGFIGIGVGAALLATGVTLLLTAPDPDKGDGEQRMATGLRPAIVAGPDGATLWLHGYF